MQNSQQLTQIKQNNKKTPLDESQGVKNQLRSTFMNPICKQTYRALPKIYGKKKKHSKAITEISQQTKPQKITNLSSTKINLFSQPKSQQKRSNTDKIIQNNKNSLSQPKFCSKKNCSCHLQQQKLKKRKVRLKFNSTTVGYMRLPQIQKFQLCDLQSKHKVSMKGLGSLNSQSKGLHAIIQQQNQTTAILKNSQTKLHKSNQKLLNSGNTNSLNKTYNKIFNPKHKIRAKFNKIKFQISEEADEENSSDENFQPEQKYSQRYKTEQPQSPSYSKSVIFNQSMFKASKNKSTKFTELNKSDQIYDGKLLRKPSQFSNVLFRIPQQKQYFDYVCGYNSINKDFNLKVLFKMSNFKIIKSEKSVYFGEVDKDLKRQGFGVQVTEKQIFQGKYDKDHKVQGCERNIDGIYYGGYKNGIRSGYGVFQWNNGERFQGNWSKGVKNGYGIWTSQKHDRYEGQWLNNRQHGQGVFKHRNSTYKGIFKNFLKDGKGQQIFENGDFYKGQYKHGKPHGKGRYEWKEGGYYQGQFYQGMREGIGKWVDSDRTIYQGSFKADFKHGLGKQVQVSGQIFEGYFTQGKRKSGKIINKTTSQDF